MIMQIQIFPNPSQTLKDKGDFFEDLLRNVMEKQRYEVIQRIKFTGTEIDLLCQHKDRTNDTGLLECKARVNIESRDIEGFCFDILTKKKAKYGFFLHTTEIKGDAAGEIEELKKEYPEILYFWGPEKIIELLEDCKLIIPRSGLSVPNGLTPTKQILVYSYTGNYWVTIFSNQVLPTHYTVENALSIDSNIPNNALELISGLDELKSLQIINYSTSITVPKTSIQFDTVAEIQEAEQWDDYHPVGSKFFVGRGDLRQNIYQFIHNVISDTSARRIFFVEGKSGWGKSSLLAHIKARSRNIHNRNSFYVLAVDSRSANTAEFVGLAFAKLVMKAADEKFIPSKFAQLNITSAFDILSSKQVQDLLLWLKINNRELVLIFDQFEDIFRKEDLFKAFHKLMMDINNQRGLISIGFSWKSEISIPIDNPAYSWWQQARDLAETFKLDEFLEFEIDQVLRQLEQLSQQHLPSDLKRKLKENSQGFPWLTKKISIHCYHQMLKGVIAEDLVDQNLNVNELFREDLETLSPEESRALKLIAQRGYNGNQFDVAEIDDQIQEKEINTLRDKRLIVRSGTKYNVYWDVFRDFIVEGKAPNIGESFLLRQYPAVCEKTFKYILENVPCTIDGIMSGVELRNKKEGTVLNRVRELRNLGVINKIGTQYLIRNSIKNIDDFKKYMKDRLKDHIVVRNLEKSSSDTITQLDVINALRKSFKGYRFEAKTWVTYSKYFIVWLNYTGIDLGNRIVRVPRVKKGVNEFTPQWRPDKDINLFISFKGKDIVSVRDNKVNKGLYDLKTLGLLTYEGQKVYLSKRGITLLKADDKTIRKQIAEYASYIPRIAVSCLALTNSRKSDAPSYKELLSPILENISSSSYKAVALAVLKSWAKFINNEQKIQ